MTKSQSQTMPTHQICLSPYLIPCSTYKTDEVPISYYAQPPNMTKYWISYSAQPTKLTKSQSHSLLTHQILLSLNLILCSTTKYDKVLISYFAQPQDHCPHTPLNCSSVTHFIPHHLPIAHTCSYLVAHQSSVFWVWNRCCPPGAHMFLNTSFSFG